MVAWKYEIYFSCWTGQSHSFALLTYEISWSIFIFQSSHSCIVVYIDLLSYPRGIHELDGNYFTYFYSIWRQRESETTFDYVGAIKQEFNGGGTRVCAKSTRNSTEIINRCGEWFLQKFTTNRVMAINPTSIHLLEKIYITL